MSAGQVVHPKLPDSNIQYTGILTDYNGPSSEFNAWTQEPLWRRMFGLTEHDRLRRAREPGVPIL